MCRLRRFTLAALIWIAGAPFGCAPPEAVDGAGGGAGCDADGDGIAGPSCAGPDCCDGDARAFPGSVDFHETPDACGGYDYDCSGDEEPRYPNAAGSCDGTACSVTQGFPFANVACGDSGSLLATCIPSSMSPCTPQYTIAVQACR